MNTWYWEHLKPVLMVETAKISAQMQLSHILAYKQDLCSAEQHTRAYPALLQYFIHMFLHNIKLICTQHILLIVQGRCILINKVNGMVKQTMWILARLLKHIYKFIT